MNLTINILLDQLRKYKLEAYVNGMEERSFSRPALLPRDYEIMRPDLIHVCRLSDALRASAQMIWLISASETALPTIAKLQTLFTE